MGIARSRRRLATLTAAAALALLPLAAPAQAWVEQAGYDVPDGAVAACLRAGGPGELTLLGELRRTTAATDLLRIAPSPERPPAPHADTTLGWPGDCAETIAASGAPTLLAGKVHPRAPRDWTGALHVARVGARPARIPRPPGTTVGQVTVAASPNGAAALVWVETRSHRGGEMTRPAQLMAAVRRSATGRFGRARRVAAEAPDWTPPVAGVDARGRVSVAWIGSDGPPDRDGRAPDDVIRLASSRADGSFAPPRDLSGTWSGQVALAVAPNGRALLAAGAFDTQVAYERRPGRRRFERVRLPYPGTPDKIAVAIDDRGGAAIVYESSSTWALLRRPGERRFRDVEVHRPPEDDDGGSWSFGSGALGTRPGPPEDDARGRGMHVRLGADGAIVVTWVALVDGERVATAHAAHGTLADGFSPAAALGGACRSANATTPVELPDGRLGAAWTDNADVALVDGEEWPLAGGRLHVARPDPPGPPAVAPVPLGLSAELLPGASGAGRVRTGEHLRLRVRCAGGPCDVRAVARAQTVREAMEHRLPPGFGVPDPVELADATHVPAGAEGELELRTVSGRSFAAPGRIGSPQLSLIACTPNGPVTDRLTIAPRLTGLPLRPVPRPLDLRARRRGNAVRVTWRTAAPALDAGFAVYGEVVGDDGALRGRAVDGAGRTRFAAILRDPSGRFARVRVVAEDSERGQNAASAAVPVRRR